MEKNRTLSENRIVVHGTGNIALVVYSVVGTAPCIIIVPGEGRPIRTLLSVVVGAIIIGQAKAFLICRRQHVGIDQIATIAVGAKRRTIFSILVLTPQQHNQLRQKREPYPGDRDAVVTDGRGQAK